MRPHSVHYLTCAQGRSPAEIKSPKGYYSVTSCSHVNRSLTSPPLIQNSTTVHKVIREWSMVNGVSVVVMKVSITANVNLEFPVSYPCFPKYTCTHWSII